MEVAKYRRPWEEGFGERIEWCGTETYLCAKCGCKSCHFFSFKDGTTVCGRCQKSNHQEDRIRQLEEQLAAITKQRDALQEHIEYINSCGQPSALVGEEPAKERKEAT
jgi:hypothetical protein